MIGHAVFIIVMDCNKCACVCVDWHRVCLLSHYQLPVPTITPSSNRWSWDPEEERRRQEKWQKEQERLLQVHWVRLPVIMSCNHLDWNLALPFWKPSIKHHLAKEGYKLLCFWSSLIATIPIFEPWGGRREILGFWSWDHNQFSFTVPNRFRIPALFTSVQHIVVKSCPSIHF